MPNGRNAGRLYPGIPGDREVVLWKDGEAGMRWQKERSYIGPLSFLDTREKAEAWAKEHETLFIDADGEDRALALAQEALREAARDGGEDYARAIDVIQAMRDDPEAW